jgi:PleD family two-component response regulator
VPEQENNVILVVDDDLDVAEMVAAYLSVHGYRVRTVRLGEAAVREALKNPPDLVIQDINLPDIDGFEVAYRLRNNRRTKDIPIIFLTEKRALSDRLQGLELGADDYITKPFDVQELRLRVRNALRRTSQGTLTNPITGLPEGVLVDDRLEECLRENGWALILVSLGNLARFREHYGFVAADDVLRAVTLMIHNAVRDRGGINDFVGHFAQDEFVVVTSIQNQFELGERIKVRLQQSLEYFYPLKDRERKRLLPERLVVHIRLLSAEQGMYSNLADLRSKLARAGALV